MTLFVFLLFLLAASDAEYHAEYPAEKLNAEFGGLYNCPELEGKARLENIFIMKKGRAGDNYAVYGNFVTDIPIDEKFKMRYTLNRCPSKTERGMCEAIPSHDFFLCKQNISGWEIQGFFRALSIKGDVLECPVKPGKYHFAIEHWGKEMTTIGMEGYWVEEYAGFIEDKQVMCIRMEYEEKPEGKKRSKKGNLKKKNS